MPYHSEVLRVERRYNLPSDVLCIHHFCLAWNGAMHHMLCNTHPENFTESAPENRNSQPLGCPANTLRQVPPHLSTSSLHQSTGFHSLASFVKNKNSVSLG